MGATGETVSNVLVEQIGMRCPIGDCKTVLVDPYCASEVEAGNCYANSNMLVMALKDRDADATDVYVPCAYEIPLLQIGADYPVKPRASETWVVGQRLGFKDSSDIFVILTAAFNPVAYALKAKAANASECLIHFKGDTEADIAISS